MEKEAVEAYSEVLSRCLPKGTEKKNMKTIRQNICYQGQDLKTGPPTQATSVAEPIRKAERGLRSGKG
jgi:hypothetical protein